MSGLGGFLNRVALLSSGVGIGGFILQQSLYTVEGGHRAVIWDRFSGVQETVKDEGTHFRIPFITVC